MEIEVQVTKTIEVEVDVTVTPVDGRLPGPPGPRYRFLFSDDLVLERIDDKDSGNGLPHSPQNRLAGTHSGFSRRRLAAAESSQRPTCRSPGAAPDGAIDQRQKDRSLAGGTLLGSLWV